MVINYSRKFLDELDEILEFISQDKPNASKNFNLELKAKINDIKDHPKIYRKSLSFDDENYRDLIYKGYTVPYFVGENKILILGIFKQNLWK